MIADQRDFVAWWDEHIRDAGNPTLIVADRQQLTVEEAEQITGVKKWQVSRWRTKLAKEDAYRNAILEAAQRRAGLRDFFALGEG
jgi:hypothetical protein